MCLCLRDGAVDFSPHQSCYLKMHDGCNESGFIQGLRHHKSSVRVQERGACCNVSGSLVVSPAMIVVTCSEHFGLKLQVPHLLCRSGDSPEVR